MVLGPGGRTPPPGQRRVVALFRFARACWRFFRGGLRRCGLIAGIGGGTSRPARRGPKGPPPPSRPRAGPVSCCSRRRSDPGDLVPPCSPPPSTCCGSWRARRALQASCPCRAPSQSAIRSLAREGGAAAQASQRRLSVPCLGQGCHVQGALGLGGHGGGSPQHRRRRPWLVGGGAGRLHHRASAFRAEGAMLCGAPVARAAPVQGRPEGARGASSTASP